MNHSKTLYVNLVTRDGREMELEVLVPASSDVENKFAAEVALAQVGLSDEDVVSGSVLEWSLARGREVSHPGSARSAFGEYPFGRCVECGEALSISRSCMNRSAHASA